MAQIDNNHLGVHIVDNRNCYNLKGLNYDIEKWLVIKTKADLSPDSQIAKDISEDASLQITYYSRLRNELIKYYNETATNKIKKNNRT